MSLPMDRLFSKWPVFFLNFRPLNAYLHRKLHLHPLSPLKTPLAKAATCSGTNSSTNPIELLKTRGGLGLCVLPRNTTAGRPRDWDQTPQQQIKRQPILLQLLLELTAARSKDRELQWSRGTEDNLRASTVNEKESVKDRLKKHYFLHIKVKWK